MNGKKAKIAKRGKGRVVIVRPKAGAKKVTVVIRGVNKRGKKVTVKRRLAVCR